MLTLKQKLLVIAAMLAGIAIGGLTSLFQNPYIEASRSFTVENRRQVAQDVYDYEGYYTLQTANEAAKTLVSWLMSPGGVSAVYRDAGVDKSFKKLRSYERAFAVKRSDTPFFEVRYRAATRIDAEKLSASIEKLLDGQLASFQSSSSLSLASSPLVVVERPVVLARNLFYGALLAVALAVFGILFDKAIKSGA